MFDDILRAIEKINERMPDNGAAFMADEVLQVWAIHHLQLIGEGARHLSQHLRESHNDDVCTK